MKIILSALLLIFSTQLLFSQDQPTGNAKSNIGKFYLYWGWNRGWYSNSDISFRGEDYDFKLKEVEANDRQTPFALNPYLHPGWFTIPQYNFRFGFFIADKWEISYGMDHMKYVMAQNQTVKILGEIQNSNTTYDGQYDHDEIVLSEDFLKFEHTDGLNYGNFEIRRFDVLYTYKILQINYLAGGGAGFLLPKTNTTLLAKDRYDEFHLAGFGLGAVAGINLTFWNHFFVQSEYKVGYINMPDIRTTKSTADKAKQAFFFSQLNIVFGYAFHFEAFKNH